MAEAKDPENDQILYRFFLNDDPVTKWEKENHWVWTTTEDDLGDSQIEVQVRDGKHAGPDKYDANRVTSFIINAPHSVPQTSTNQYNLAKDWNSKGHTLFGQGKYEDAIKAFDEAIRIDPNYVDAWVWKGIALAGQGKYEDAIKAYDEAIRIDPQQVDAWGLKGNALAGQGKYDEAIKAYDRDIEFNPGQSCTWYHKSEALKALGRDSEAEAALAKGNDEKLEPCV